MRGLNLGKDRVRVRVRDRVRVRGRGRVEAGLTAEDGQGQR